MLEICTEAMERALGAVSNDEALVLGEKQFGEWHIRSVRLAMDRHDDGPFVQLALEHVLKSGSPEDFHRLSEQYDDELEEPFRALYQQLFGDLPDGPAPKLRYISCWKRPSPTFQHADWVRHRNALYGPPPYDVDELRRKALE